VSARPTASRDAAIRHSLALYRRFAAVGCQATAHRGTRRTAHPARDERLTRQTQREQRSLLCLPGVRCTHMPGHAKRVQLLQARLHPFVCPAAFVAYTLIVSNLGTQGNLFLCILSYLFQLFHIQLSAGYKVGYQIQNNRHKQAQSHRT